MKIKNVMKSPIETVKSVDSIKSAADIMVRKGIGSLLVITEDNKRSIITERDLVKAISDENSAGSVADYANKPLITIDQESYVGDAAQLMLTKNIRRLIVTNSDGDITGIISIRDITLAVHESFLAIFDS